MCGHHFPHRSRFLPTGRFWRKSHIMLIDSTLINRILSPTRRNYTANFISRTIIGKISTIYHDFGHIVYMDHRLCAQRTLQVSKKKLNLKCRLKTENKRYNWTRSWLFYSA